MLSNEIEDEMSREWDRIFGNSSESKSVDKPTSKRISTSNLMTYSEAAEVLKITKNAVKLLVKRKRLTPVKIGNINYLDYNDVSQYKVYARSKKSDPFSEQSTNLTKNKVENDSKLLNSLTNEGVTGDTVLSPPHFRKGVAPKVTNFNPENDSKLLNLKVDDGGTKHHTLSPPHFRRGVEDFEAFKEAKNTENIPLTVPQTATKLKCSDRQVRNLIYQKKLQAIQIDKYYLITEEAIVLYLEEKTAAENLKKQLSDSFDDYSENRFKYENPALNETCALLQCLEDPQTVQEIRNEIKQNFTNYLNLSEAWLVFDLGIIISFANKYGIDSIIFTEDEFALKNLNMFLEAAKDGVNFAGKVINVNSTASI